MHFVGCDCEACEANKLAFLDSVVGVIEGSISVAGVLVEEAYQAESVEAVGFAEEWGVGGAGFLF